jgi:hypothetical protein
MPVAVVAIVVASGLAYLIAHADDPLAGSGPNVAVTRLVELLLLVHPPVPGHETGRAALTGRRRDR